MSTLLDKFGLRPKGEDEQPSLLQKAQQSVPQEDESLLTKFSTQEQSRGPSLLEAASSRISNVKAEIPRDFYDITGGAATYGAADTAALLAKGISRSYIHSSGLEDFAQSMEQFKEHHPEYAPIEVRDVQDLLSRPDALTSRLFGGAAYMALQAGTLGMPLGLPITAATSYAIEAQRAYEDAKRYDSPEHPVTEQEAELAGKYAGATGMFFSILMSNKLLHLAKGDRTILAQRMAKSTNSLVRALGPAAGHVQDAAVLGGIGAIQGMVDEGVALGTYGKPIDKEFWDRRLQEGVTGAVTATLLGTGSRLIKKALGVKEGTPKEVTVNVYDRDSAAEYFSKVRGLPADTANAAAGILDNFASQWSEKTGAPKERAFAEVLNEENFKNRKEDNTGDALLNNVAGLLDSFDKSPHAVIDSFLNAMVKNLPNAEKQSLVKSLKLENASAEEADVKMQKAFVRYLWEGNAPAPELQASFESMRELLRDSYKKVSSIGSKKITPETRAILDGLLSPETDEIGAARQRISTLEAAIKTAFSEAKKSDVANKSISPEFMEELMKPVSEEKISYQQVPNEELPVEVKTVVQRKRTKEEIAKAIEEKLAEQESPREYTVGQILDARQDSLDKYSKSAPRLRTGQLQDADVAKAELQSQLEHGKSLQSSTDAIDMLIASKFEKPRRMILMSKGIKYRAEIELKSLREELQTASPEKKQNILDRIRGLNVAIDQEAQRVADIRDHYLPELQKRRDEKTTVDPFKSEFRIPAYKAGGEGSPLGEFIGFDPTFGKPSEIKVDPRETNVTRGWLSEKGFEPETAQEGITPTSNEPTQLAKIEGLDRTKAESKLLLDSAYAELDRLQKGRLIPGELSAVARRSQSDGWQRDQLDGEVKKDTRLRTKLLTLLDSTRAVLDISTPLDKYPWGRKLKESLSNIVSFTKRLNGTYRESIDETYRSLTYKERKWLTEVDNRGFPNIQKLLDTTLGPVHIRRTDSNNISRLREFAWKMQDDFGRMAERLGITVKLPDGREVPYKQPDRGRMIRFPLENARRAVQEKTGPVYQAIVDAVKRNNPELANKDIKEIGKLIEPLFVDTEIRSNSALENARLFKTMPSVVEVNGRPQAIYEYDPLRYMRKAVSSMAQRIAWVKEAGQSRLDSVKTKLLKEFSATLGVEPKFTREMAKAQIYKKILNMEPEKLQAKLDAKFLAKGKHPPDVERKVADITRQMEIYNESQRAVTEPETPARPFVDPMLGDEAFRKAQALAKELGIRIGPGREDYLDAINKVTATEMGSKEMKELRSFARKIKGVADSEDPHTLLSEIKRRLAEDPVDYMEQLQKNLSIESGGSVDKYAIDTIKQSQGIPLTLPNRDLISRSVKSIASIVGTLQTSMSPLLQIPQTMMLVPSFGGLINYLKAAQKVITKYRISRSEINALTGVADTYYSYGTSPGYRLEGWVKNFRHAFSSAIGLKFMADFNNVVAGETFKRLSENWQTPGVKLGEGDFKTMKALKLSEKEIADIKAGKMSPLTHAKIVQRGIDLTQFVSQSGHERGLIEHSPILSTLFAYSNYAIGTARAVGTWYHTNVADLIEKPNARTPAKLGQAIYTTSLLLAGSLGAGFMSRILRDAVTGNTRQRMDESTMQQMAGALMEVSILGPTQRIIDALRFGGGDEEHWVMGLMPQVKALTNGLSALYNEFTKHALGKTTDDAMARYGFVDNLGEAFKQNTPLVKTFMQWMDRAQFPEYTNYLEAKAASAKYRRDLKTTLGGTDAEPKDPGREAVFFYVARGDLEGAIDASHKYREEVINKFIADPVSAMTHGHTPDKEMEKLRSSLLARAPINIAEGLEKLDYLSKLPKDRLVKYYQADLKYRTLVDIVAPTGR